MKKGILRKVLASALTVAAVTGLVTGCGSTGTDSAASNDNKTVYRTLDEIKSSGTINIGVFSDKNPFGYVDENGEYQGYDVYFANRLGEDLGVKVNFVSTEAASRIEYLQTGKVDLILANFTVTKERAEEVDFALPYMNVALGVISLPGSAARRHLCLYYRPSHREHGIRRQARRSKRPCHLSVWNPDTARRSDR